MYDPEMRKDCPMRGNLGNCSPVGGFCMDAVSDEICEAVHNAYDQGFHNAVRTLKEQEEQIKTRDESLEKAREEIKWLRGMLKEQEPVTYKAVKAGEKSYPFYDLVCTGCGNKTGMRMDWKYCPGCGRAVKWE